MTARVPIPVMYANIIFKVLIFIHSIISILKYFHFQHNKIKTTLYQLFLKMSSLQFEEKEVEGSVSIFLKEMKSLVNNAEFRFDIFV